MTATLQVEFENQHATASTAYRRFMMSAALLNRRGLSTSEAGKAQTIYSEALSSLTVSLTRMREISDILDPAAVDEPERQRVPRYSSDARRENLA